MATTKDFSFIAASIRPVATIWLTPPKPVHSSDDRPGAGAAAPLAAETSARNMSAKGRPNRKRTKVAPAVPSVAMRSRCMALRAVCAPEAATVKTIHNQEGMALIGTGAGV